MAGIIGRGCIAGGGDESIFVAIICDGALVENGAGIPDQAVGDGVVLGRETPCLAGVRTELAAVAIGLRRSGGREDHGIAGEGEPAPAVAIGAGRAEIIRAGDDEIVIPAPDGEMPRIRLRMLRARAEVEPGHGVRPDRIPSGAEIDHPADRQLSGQRDAGGLGCQRLHALVDQQQRQPLRIARPAPPLPRADALAGVLRQAVLEIAGEQQRAEGRGPLVGLQHAAPIGDLIAWTGHDVASIGREQPQQYLRPVQEVVIAADQILAGRDAPQDRRRHQEQILIGVGLVAAVAMHLIGEFGVVLDGRGGLCQAWAGTRFPLDGQHPLQIGVKAEIMRLMPLEALVQRRLPQGIARVDELHEGGALRRGEGAVAPVEDEAALIAIDRARRAGELIGLRQGIGDGGMTEAGIARGEIL